MFSDPFSAVMALILLAFIGTLAVFFRIWRELEGLRRAVDDVRKNLQYYAVDAAQQNRDLAALIREQRGGRQTDTGGDCLGELLERGIPNLAAAPSVAAPAVSTTAPAASTTERTLPDIVSGTGMLDDDEEDFFRRFEKTTDKGFAS